MGKTPRDLGVPGEQQLKGRGVSYCAVCDGPLFKGKTVAVIGAGDPALDAANYLSGIVRKVYLIQRTAHPIGDEELTQSLRSRGNVEFLSGRIVSEIKGKTKVESVVLKDVSAKEQKEEGIKKLQKTSV